ncbi:MAG: FxLYD domain-containing protein [Thermoplasmatota archaeon]
MKCIQILLVVLLITLLGTLSGCIVEEINEEDGNDTNEEEISDVEVINYTIVTQKLTFDGRFETIGEGFFYSENAYRYLLRGKVKNNGTENISKTYVFVDFYDDEDILLHQIFDIIFNLSPNDIKDFAVDFTKHDSDDFLKVSYVQFKCIHE